MKSWMMLIAAGLAALALAACSDGALGPDEGLPGAPAISQSRVIVGNDDAYAVIANRGSGSVSVIDARSLAVKNLALTFEDDEPLSEPMYVVHVNSRVFVGDRANDRVAIFNRATLEVEGTLPAGQGVFHMWADPQGKQLWVSNDIDRTLTVLDPKQPSAIATVDLPADLLDMGGQAP